MSLEGPPSRAQCVREAQDAAAMLAVEGMEVPEWSKFSDPDFRAPQPVDPEVGEWTHGWQLLATTLFATSAHMPPLSTDHQALRASQRGPVLSSPRSGPGLFLPRSCSSADLLRLHLSIVRS